MHYHIVIDFFFYSLLFMIINEKQHMIHSRPLSRICLNLIDSRSRKEMKLVRSVSLFKFLKINDKEKNELFFILW